MLALTFAVGLAGLLIGLSVAPSTLPGDTFHVTRKAAAGAAVVLGQTEDRALQPGTADPVHLVPALVVAVALTGLLAPIGMPIGRESPRRPARRTPPVSGCRGPPAPAPIR